MPSAEPHGLGWSRQWWANPFMDDGGPHICAISSADVENL